MFNLSALYYLYVINNWNILFWNVFENLFHVVEKCPAGTQAIKTGCKNCSAGTFSGENQRECTACPYPLTSKPNSNSSTQCLRE